MHTRASRVGSRLIAGAVIGLSFVAVGATAAASAGCPSGWSIAFDDVCEMMVSADTAFTIPAEATAIEALLIGGGGASANAAGGGGEVAFVTVGPSVLGGVIDVWVEFGFGGAYDDDDGDSGFLSYIEFSRGGAYSDGIASGGQGGQETDFAGFLGGESGSGNAGASVVAGNEAAAGGGAKSSPVDDFTGGEGYSSFSEFNGADTALFTDASTTALFLNGVGWGGEGSSDLAGAAVAQPVRGYGSGGSRTDPTVRLAGSDGLVVIRATFDDAVVPLAGGGGGGGQTLEDTGADDLAPVVTAAGALGLMSVGALLLMRRRACRRSA